MACELAKAKLKVMAQVPYIQKQRASGLNYSFAGEAAILEKLHPAMREAGLTFCPSGCVLIAQEQYTTKSGAAMNRVIVQVTFALTHADSGQTEAIQTLGEGSDSGDKATSKAMTSAFKYALRQAFLIETGDDPDTTPSYQQERDHQPARPPATPARPQQQQSAAKVRPTRPEFADLLKSRGWGWNGVVDALNERHGTAYTVADKMDNVLTDHICDFAAWLKAQPEVAHA